MTEPIYDCMVIGGGISGITFAHYLHGFGKKIVILEKNDRIGGRVCTKRVAGNGFWYEAGAHTCYNSYTTLLSIAHDIGLAGKIHHLDKFSYMAYEDARLKKIFHEVSIPALLLHGPKIFFSSQQNKTVREYYTNLVGRRNYDHVFSKMFRAILSQDADDYPAELLMKKRKTRMKELPRRLTFAQGLSSLLDAIVEKDGIEVVISCEPTHIERTEEGGQSCFTVETVTGERFRAASLAMAIDPPSAARLLKGVDPSLAGLLSSIPTFRSESLSVVVDKEKMSAPRMAGIIPLSDDFLSAVSRDLTEHPSLRGFTFHFEKDKKTDGEQLETACRALGISRADISECTTTSHILPSLGLRHLGMAGKVEAQRSNDNIYLLGNYFGGLSLEDCVIRSHTESERYHLMEHQGNRIK